MLDEAWQEIDLVDDLQEEQVTYALSEESRQGITSNPNLDC